MKSEKVLKKFSLFILVILVVTLFAIPVGANQIFTDLSPMHWCYDKIMDFAQKGYVCGYEDNTFRPDNAITRAEYVKIVNNFFGYELEYEKNSNFSDVSSGDWFAPYVNEAVERGYITGFEDGTFRPQDPIRRQEATVILARILKIDDEVYPANHKDGLAQYSDSDEVQDWARVAIHSYSVYNFINGYEDGSLKILRNVTRAETVELLHILEQKIVIDRPSSGGTTKYVKTPTIELWRRIYLNSEYAYLHPVLTENGWVNNEEATIIGNARGVFVNTTTTTNGATINEKLDVRADDRQYITTASDDLTNSLFLTDGVYNLSAYATKSGYKKSSSAQRKVKVDTVAPIVIVSQKEIERSSNITITFTIEDPKNEDVNVISGLNEETIRYAWFKITYVNNIESYVRASQWQKLELNAAKQASLSAPTASGEYMLAISVADYAENNFGYMKDVVNLDGNDEKTETIIYDFIGRVGNNFKEEDNDDVLLADIKCDYPKNDGTKAEPNDVLNYTITLSEKYENGYLTYPIEVVVALDNKVEAPTNLPTSATYDPATHTISWNVSSKNDTLSYKVKVKNTVSAGSKTETDIISGAIANKNIVDIENTVKVKVETDKNIVLVLDISGSMDYCAEHTKKFIMQENDKGHEEKDGSFTKCNGQTKFEAMQEAAKSFAKSILKSQSTKDVTLSIVTFDANSNLESGETLLNPQYEDVEKLIDELKIGKGTNINGAIEKATEVFNSDSMLKGKDVIDILIFLSDGAPSKEEYFIQTETLDAFKRISAIAFSIGVGDKYSESELLKIVDNDRKKLFEVSDGTELLEAFNDIAIIINSMQSTEGEISITAADIDEIYPIKISYTNELGADVLVTVLQTQLTENHITVSGNNVIWNISNYSGCSNFSIELNGANE